MEGQTDCNAALWEVKFRCQLDSKGQRFETHGCSLPALQTTYEGAQRVRRIGNGFDYELDLVEMET